MAILLFFISISAFSQKMDTYENYYRTINEAEKYVLVGDYQKANGLYKSLINHYNFFYKDLYNASTVSMLANDNTSNVIYDSLLQKQNQTSDEIAKIYKIDQSNRKTINKLLKSKKKRISEDESNFRIAKEILLNLNYDLNKDDIKKLALIITHNVDKVGFDTQFINNLKNLIYIGRLHPILYSNIYDRYYIMNFGSRYFNNNWTYVSGNGVKINDKAGVLSAPISIQEIDDRRANIFLNSIESSQKLLPMYIKLGLKYYIFL